MAAYFKIPNCNLRNSFCFRYCHNSLRDTAVRRGLFINGHSLTSGYIPHWIAGIFWVQISLLLPTNLYTIACRVLYWTYKMNRPQRMACLANGYTNNKWKPMVPNDFYSVVPVSETDPQKSSPQDPLSLSDYYSQFTNYMQWFSVNFSKITTQWSLGCDDIPWNTYFSDYLVYLSEQFHTCNSNLSHIISKPTVIQLIIREF